MSMKTRNVRKGDLAYIPSHVEILKYSKAKGPSFVKMFYITEQPVNLLVVEEVNQKGKIAVHYQGDVWYVDHKNVYSQRET